MSYNEGDFVRRPSLPPLSTRTLHHPSFLPMYLAAGFGRHHVDCSSQTVHPIIPSEFFYSDPTMSCGWRVPNIVSELRVFDCFQLNTPPPVMSACLAPPARPDPFRPGPHPTRDLGSLSYAIDSLHPPAPSSRVILQLTQEEDQAMTNLLKLHHDESLHPELMTCTAAEEAHKPFFCHDVQHPEEAGVQSQMQKGRCWSHTELEAADTLLSCSRLIEKDEICGQNLNKSDDSSVTEAQQGSETPSVTDYGPNDISLSCPREHGEPGWGCLGFMQGDGVLLPVHQSPGASGDFTEVWTLSESEGDAVHVLLTLCDTVLSDIVQGSSQT